MNAEALRTARRVRAEACDIAAGEVSRCLALSEAARHVADAAASRIRTEADAATNLATDDGAVEAFAAWLPQGRHAAALALDRRATADATLAVARAGLSAARVALEVIDRLLARGAAEDAARRTRAAGVAALDALGRPTPRAGD